jgi:methylated-DNA-[protein]-cysteine S-methyltransferase
MEYLFFLTAQSSFGEFAIIWYLTEGIPRVLRLTLPGLIQELAPTIRKKFPQAQEGDQQDMVDLAGDIIRYLDGDHLQFDLQWLGWETRSEFQARVLRAEYGIPRGWVSTYGRIANHLGVPGGARAVGNALATNPFPLLIPCHRAVRSSGDLGGYQGGLEMKKTLLEMEGVKFISPRKVSLTKVHY